MIDDAPATDPGPAGGTLEAYLADTGLRDEVYAAAVKDVTPHPFDGAPGRSADQGSRAGLES